MFHHTTIHIICLFMLCDVAGMGCCGYGVLRVFADIQVCAGVAGVAGVVGLTGDAGLRG